MDVSGPFRLIKRSSYTLKRGFNVGMAACRGSVKFDHDAVAKVMHCRHKNLMAEE